MNRKMENKRNWKIYLIYSLVFAISFGVSFAFFPSFDLTFAAIGLIGGLLLGLFVSFIVQAMVKHGDEAKKYIGVKIRLDEIEILIYLVTIVSSQIVFTNLVEFVPSRNFLGWAVGIAVGMILVKLYRILFKEFIHS